MTINIATITSWANYKNMFVINLDNLSKNNFNFEYSYLEMSKLTNTTEKYAYSFFDYVVGNVKGNFIILDKDCTTVEQLKEKFKNKTYVYELATAIEEDIECTNKIYQFADNTEFYERSGGELELSVTNNDVIAQANTDIKDLQEKLMKLQEKTEWQKLSDKYNVYYRKCNGSIEINVSIYDSEGLSLESCTETVVGHLPQKYKPSKSIFIPVFARLKNGTFGNYIRLIIKDTGVVSLFNWSNTAVSETINAFVSYNV